MSVESQVEKQPKFWASCSKGTQRTVSLSIPNMCGDGVGRKLGEQH